MDLSMKSQIISGIIFLVTVVLWGCSEDYVEVEFKVSCTGNVNLENLRNIILSMDDLFMPLILKT